MPQKTLIEIGASVARLEKVCYCLEDRQLRILILAVDQQRPLTTIFAVETESADEPGVMAFLHDSGLLVTQRVLDFVYMPARARLS